MYLQVTIVLIFLVLLSITVSFPTGCWQRTPAKTVCDFRYWSPPLLDSQYKIGPYQVEVKKLSGNFSSQAFIGLMGDRATSSAFILLDCDQSDVSLPANTFTSNLNWVRSLYLNKCYIRNGIAAGTLSFLIGLTSLQVTNGIFGPMNAYSLSGLMNLTNVFIQAEFLEKTFPAGLFTKLTAVTNITIQTSSLTSIPPGAFDGLTSLTSIDLSGNLLMSLPVGTFDNLVSLMRLTLDGNNWKCGCHFTWLSTWLVYSGVTATMTCSSPVAYKGFALNRAIAELGCTTSTSSPKIRSRIIAVLINSIPFIISIFKAVIIDAIILTEVLIYLFNRARVHLSFDELS
ncbi:hypothetical protein CHS0354_015626 [Potamilus streckersoni]|uniref:LRRCT domain-containing protein n=1 Tax=Potamilus streckersoni TaxID=2493646 RepID=A0AAE0T6C2_9BIVA|nr:hypothetical protein CHS0354_015626 [Potamilus streckersoni]